MIESTGKELLENVIEVATTYKDLSYKKFQILAPMYKTIYGIDEINNRLQKIYNPKTKEKKEVVVGEVTFREGDKVIELTKRIIYNINCIKEVKKRKIKEKGEL